jgi:hypothetical protein
VQNGIVSDDVEGAMSLFETANVFCQTCFRGFKRTRSHDSLAKVRRSPASHLTNLYFEDIVSWSGTQASPQKAKGTSRPITDGLADQIACAAQSKTIRAKMTSVCPITIRIVTIQCEVLAGEIWIRDMNDSFFE